ISVFDIDANTGLLSLNGDTPLPTNSGPRSLVVDPSGKFVYVTLSSIDKVAAFRIDPTSGALTQVNGSPFDTGLTPLGVVATGAIQ
ncbi:MAG TPA: beta-propeller fold lactonase family protein, partial [Burkholderiales bacterium]